MIALNEVCQGYSHIESGKPCQDNSFSEVNPNGIGIAIISDGHGGKRYFRSEFGSKFITGIVRDKVMSFISNFGDSHLKGTTFSQRKSIKTQIEDNDFNKQDIMAILELASRGLPVPRRLHLAHSLHIPSACGADIEGNPVAHFLSNVHGAQDDAIKHVEHPHNTRMHVLRPGANNSTSRDKFSAQAIFSYHAT